MFISEIKNVLKNRTLRFFFLFIFILNIFLVFKNEYSRNAWEYAAPSDYNSAFEKIMLMEPGRAKKTVKNLYESYSKGTNLEKACLYRELYSEVRYAGSYDDYYIQKKKEYQSRKDFRIFSYGDKYTKILQ